MAKEFVLYRVINHDRYEFEGMTGDEIREALNLDNDVRYYNADELPTNLEVDDLNDWDDDALDDLFDGDADAMAKASEEFGKFFGVEDFNEFIKCYWATIVD